MNQFYFKCADAELQMRRRLTNIKHVFMNFTLKLGFDELLIAWPVVGSNTVKSLIFHVFSFCGETFMTVKMYVDEIEWEEEVEIWQLKMNEMTEEKMALLAKKTINRIKNYIS